MIQIAWGSILFTLFFKLIVFEIPSLAAFNNRCQVQRFGTAIVHCDWQWNAHYLLSSTLFFVEKSTWNVIDREVSKVRKSVKLWRWNLQSRSEMRKKTFSYKKAKKKCDSTKEEKNWKNAFLSALKVNKNRIKCASIHSIFCTITPIFPDEALLCKSFWSASAGFIKYGCLWCHMSYASLLVIQKVKHLLTTILLWLLWPPILVSNFISYCNHFKYVLENFGSKSCTVRLTRLYIYCHPIKIRLIFAWINICRFDCGDTTHMCLAECHTRNGSLH